MPPVEIFDDEEEYYRHDRYGGGARHVPSPRRGRDDAYYSRRTDFLMPEHSTYTGGLHRSRSHGHQPQPNVTIYNTSKNDMDANPHIRSDQRGAIPSPLPSPRGRPMRMPGEWSVEDELAELRLQAAENRVRSRSRHRDYSPDHDRFRLEQAQERIREQEERDRMERREEIVRRKAELKYMKDKAERDEEELRLKREEDRLKKEWELEKEREERKAEHRARDKEEETKRIIAENTAKLEKKEREAKEARQRAVDEFNQKRMEEERKAKDERERVIIEYERKKFEDDKKKKDERERILLEMKIEEEKRKQKEKEEYERFLLKQREKELEEKEKKEKAEKQLEEEMRKRLHKFGFQENQVQAIIKPEKQRELQQGASPLNPVRLGGHTPTYVKVHKEHLAIETLHYYDIPYEVDSVDSDYIVILREMDQRETDILFEHTKRLRSRHNRLLIEERHDHGRNDYAWVRRRKHSVSPARRRSSPKRVVGIKEMFY